MTVNRESGFTLLELLVTMAIFGIVLGGILKVYDTNNYTYKVQEEVVAMHQNVRVAKMFLERDVRMAGCGMGAMFGFGGVTTYALENDNNSGATGSDSLTVRYIDYEAGACGTDSTGLAAPCSDLPTLTLDGSMPEASTVANLKEELGDAPFSSWLGDCYCGGTTYTQPVPLFMALITNPDGTKSDLVIITGAQNTGGLDNLSNGPNAVFQGVIYPNQIVNGYEDGSKISFFNANQYTAVVYDLVNGVLRRNGDPIAEDIDDFQIAFGLDTDNDGVVDTWVNNIDLDDDTKLEVRLVRINVLGHTASEHRGYKNMRPVIEDHAAAVSNDGFRRKLLQVTVQVRNLGLL